MKVSEGFEVSSKGSKAKFQEVPGYKEGFEVKDPEVPTFQVRVSSEVSRRKFQVKVRFQKFPK